MSKEINEFKCAVCHDIFETEVELPELEEGIVLVCDDCNEKLMKFFGTKEDA